MNEVGPGVKKSKRGGIRRTLATLGVVALAVVGALVWAVWPYVMAEARGADHEALARLNALVMEGQPEGENGWEVMREFLTEECGLTGDSISGNERWKDARNYETDPTVLLRNSWNDPNVAKHHAAFERSRWLLAHLDRAVESDRYFVPYRWDGEPLRDTADVPRAEIGLPMGAVAYLHPLAKWNLVALREAAINGDWDEAAHRLRTGLRLGGHTLHQALIIEGVMGYSLQGLALWELGHVLNEFDVPSEACDRMERVVLEEVDSARSMFHRLVEGEAIFGTQFTKAMFSTDGVFLSWRYARFRLQVENFGSPGLRALDDPPTWRERLSNVRAISSPGWGEMERIIAHASEQCRLALHGESFETRSGPFGAEGFEVPDDVAEYVMAAPATFRRFGQMLQLLEAKAHAVRAMLDLERFHAREGRWPAELTEAMSAEEASDPITGRMFEYRLVEGEARAYSLRYPASAEYVPKFEGSTVDEFEINPVRRAVEIVEDEVEPE